MTDILQLLPDVRGLVDPRAEQRYYLAFKRIYEYFEQQITKQQQAFDIKLKTQADTIAKQNSLINGFGTSLIGIQNQNNPLVTLGSGTVTTFTVTDTLIFDITNAATTPNLALKTQAKNKFLSSPTTGVDAIPTFRKIVAADITGLSLDSNILEWTAQ